MNHLLRTGTYLLILLFIFSSPLVAQNDLQKTRQALLADSKVKNFSFNDELKTISSISFAPSTKFYADDAQALIRNYFKLDVPGEEIKFQRSTSVKAGIEIQNYKLFYKGIPVVHSAYNVVLQNNKIINIEAESYALKEDFSVIPTLSEANALTKALAFVNARKYAWQSLAEDKLRAAGNPALIMQLDKLIQEHSPTGELVIAKNKYGDGQARLAWKFDIYSTEPIGRFYIYVDAATGKIILRDAIIKHTNDKVDKPFTFLNELSKKTDKKTVNTGNLQQPVPYSPLASELGQAFTRYAGTRNIFTTRVTVPVGGTTDPNNTSAQLTYSGTDPRTLILGPEQVFILKDDTRGRGVETYDMNNVGGAPISLPGLHANSLAFVDRNILAGSENIWKNETVAGTLEDHVRGTTSNGSVGVDEAFNDDIALDAHWGAEIVYDYWKNVHNRFSFDNQNSAIKSYVHYGPAYDNAFWNGSVMTYGDGSGTSANGFKPLTSLDVCAHEIGHGICSFTSDLVYESESGAMNEALSDIWAAAIERYVLVNIDPTLISVYKPFSIGEQISANPAIPLRRMDNPKARTDPDTYGGQYWINPVCTPTLANDQCGVHTNSGILNKWYYLLTVGSLAGSGPDVSYAVAGSDDGLRDNGAVYNSVPYSVTGIGFNKADVITYLMELTLTPSATFAQARTAAINAARIIYGECSAEEISVTNAWNAIGVGAAYTTCALPVISASALLTDVRETAGGFACDRYNEYNININLTVAQPGITTVNVSVGATTMSPDEYALSAAFVTYNIGETGLRTVKLRIYDDVMVEADETIAIDVTSASPASNQTFTFTVRNDDVNPLVGGTQTLLNENFEAMAQGPFAAPTPGTWGFIDKISPSNVQWAVRTDGAAVTPILFTTKRAIIEITAPVAIPGEALYDQAAEANTILRAPLINATGLNSVKVAFKYQAGGEPACDPACDYARLLYSYDGNNFSSFFDLQPLFLSFTESNFEYTLPASFNGKQFYLGIQWYDDANAGTSGSVAIDSFVVTGTGKSIESELADSVSEKVNPEIGKPSYFYSLADGELITSITNGTAHNYGCVSTELEKAGSGGFELYVVGNDHHRVADKIIRITPVTNNVAGAYTITLYFTEAQIAALEAYTGFSRTQFYIYKTSANPYTGATAANTERTAATYAALAGVGGSFSASFSTGFSAFALGAVINIPLPINCLEFKAVKKDNSVQLVWKVNQEINNSRFEIERSFDGVIYSIIGTVLANTTSNGNYDFTDASLSGKRVYYRLKQIDRTGEKRYVCSILSVPLDNADKFSISKVYPNPSAEESFVNVYTADARTISMEYVNTLGQVFNQHTMLLQPGTTRVTLKLNVRSSGNFIVRFRDEAGNLLGYQKFSRF